MNYTVLSIYALFQRQRNISVYSVLKLKCRSIAYRTTSTLPENSQMRIFEEYEEIPIKNIRNFSIIAHIDHGKSTLADRIMELTSVLKPTTANKQVLDRLQVERERGITVKAQTVSMIYKFNNEKYLLNLIDTPGHVDFSNEVERSLAACQGVILLVDANQGVQAQTVANFYLAFTKELVIIPVLNKIDLKNANPEGVALQMKNLFSINPKATVKISAKNGTGVEDLVGEVIKRIPPPPSDRNAPLKALLFDSWYDRYRGVISLVYVKDGSVRVGDAVKWYHSGNHYIVKSLGLLQLSEVPAKLLLAGQVGTMSCNMRSISEAKMGDTMVHYETQDIEPLPGFAITRPMVFAGVYPLDQSQHQLLRSAIEKLTLNDNAVTVNVDSSPALGQGWRLGFLGFLHLEVFNQRLEQEYGAEAIITSPSVTYKVVIQGKKNIGKFGGSELYVSNPLHFPDQQAVVEVQEPVVLGTIITPDSYMGDVIALCLDHRGVQQSAVNIDNTMVMLQFILPLNEILVDFHDTLKSVTSGFASFDYEDRGYMPSNLIKMNILLNGREVPELCLIVHSTKATQTGKKLCKKLLDIIPRQQFQIAIQAQVGSKIVARENLKPYRKDVTAKLYGGDVTRRKKLLKRQAEGKSKLKLIGNIALPRETFIEVLKR